MSADQGRKAPPLPPSRGRRRFLGAGTSAVPALVTLASSPALGATCFTPSRNLSQNTSLSQQAFVGSCTGSSVSAYITSNGSGWPVASTTKFHDVFTGDVFWVKNNSGPNTNGLRSCTLLEVMKLGTTSPVAPPTGKVWCTKAGVYKSSFTSVAGTSVAETINVAKHIIAAYFNCTAGFVPSNVLKASGTVPSCTDIWADFIADGKYEVMASVLWGPAGILEYFISNAIAPAA